jgi:recombination protein RecT
MNDLSKTDVTAAPMSLLKQQLADRAEAFRHLLPSHISVERLQRTVLMAAQVNPQLLAADRRTFLTACMKAAQDGLLPDGTEAAIVPFKTRVKDPTTGQWGEARLAQYMPMLAGLKKKVLQSGQVTDLFVQVVYKQELDAGRFRYREGSERALYHEPLLDQSFRPTDDDLALAYSVATFADGTRSFEVMRRWEIDEVREASQSGAQFDARGNPRESKGPWADWFAEMCKKTVLRRHAKNLPQSSDVVLTDVEAEDMAHAAQSTMQLLGSRPPDPATPLIESFDPTTGELGPPGYRPRDTDDAGQPVVEPPEQVRRPGAEPEIVAEGFDKGTEQLRQRVEAEGGQGDKPTPDRPAPEPEPEPDEPEAPASPVPGQPAPGEQPAAPEQAAGADEYGVTKTAGYKLAEEQAEDYIRRAKACELLVDLRALETEADLIVASMPEEISNCVDTAFSNARRRLTPPGEPRRL